MPNGTWRRLVLREGIHISLMFLWLVLLHQTVSTYEVEGASMEPTLQNNQYVIVDTISAPRTPQRGEVIVFHYPNNPSLEYVKRVVALPGETVSVSQGTVWIGGLALREPYLRERPRYFAAPQRVPPDTVFVLGDNRNSSSDSHLWGPVPLGNIIGRAWIAYKPFSALTWLGGQAPAIVAAQ
jgi:signal peptidase I